MKRVLLSASLVAAAAMSMAQAPNFKSPVSADGKSLDVRAVVDARLNDIIQGRLTQQNAKGRSVTNYVEQIATQKAGKPIHKQSLKPANSPAKAKAEAQEITFTAFSQTFFNNGNQFNYAGGDLYSYEVKATVDGQDVVFEGLFNMLALGTDTEEPVHGVYDAEAGTITIVPADPFETEIYLGSMYGGYYSAYLKAGEVNQSGAMALEDNLVFNVADDFSSITSVNNCAIGLYAYGYNYGNLTAYKTINLYQPVEGSKVVCFTADQLQFNTEMYPEFEESQQLLFANLGAEPAEFVIDAESDGNAFTVEPQNGEIPSMQMLSATVTFKPMEEGEYEGIITFATEQEEFLFSANGACVPYPKYDEIVESGEFNFKTCMEFPFEMGEYAGHRSAHSTNIQQYGDSWLKAEFEVPEGQIATVSWKGSSYAYMWYVSQATITDDRGNVLFQSNQYEEDASGSAKFAPGKRSITFDYMVNYAYYATPDDYLEIYGLETTYEEMEEMKAVYRTDNLLKFGNFTVGAQSLILPAVLFNEGEQPLVVTSAEGSDHFKVYPTSNQAGTLEPLSTSVEFEPNAAGFYEEDILLHTSAGDFIFHCSALVREVPDYNAILSPENEAEITWDYSTTEPFIIEGAEAVNANALHPDTVATVAWFLAEFEVPTGKKASVTWDTTLDVDTFDVDFNLTDFASVSIQHPSAGFQITRHGTQSLDSDTVYTVFSGAEDYLPGTNWVQWSLNHNGDGQTKGKDEFRVRNIKITFEDFPAYALEADVDYFDFGSILAIEGRKAQGQLNITNKGGEQMFYESFEAPEYITLDYAPSWGINYNNQMNLTFNFAPAEPGVYEGEIVVHTTSGDVTVEFYGEVESLEGCLIAEDFEGDVNWTLYDADGDGKCWDLLYNLFGGWPEGHAHSGSEGLGSTAYYYYAPDLDPDNWTFSPYFDIPAGENYELSWWRSPEEVVAGEYEHTYQVLVGTDMQKLDEFVPVFEETIDQPGWQIRRASLADFAGQKVCIAFRHFNSQGKMLLKLDDVFVKFQNAVAIRTIGQDNEAQRFDLQGRRADAQTQGITIVRRSAEDGSLESYKTIQK